MIDLIFHILVTIALILPIEASSPLSLDMDIDSNAEYGRFEVQGNFAKRTSPRTRLAAASKAAQSHVRVERRELPGCDDAEGGHDHLKLLGYCNFVARGLADNCPRGVSLGYVANPQSGEENLERTRLWPLECTAGTGPGAVLTAEMISQEFKVLPIKGSGLKYRPEEISPIINLPFIPFTDSTPQLLNTTILGTPILIEATPISFTWDYGDGSKPLTTTDPNKQLYPNHSYQHTYTRTGDVTVTLQTTWQGRYQLTGSPWQTIPGQATTFETSPTITVKESRPVNIN